MSTTDRTGLRATPSGGAGRREPIRTCIGCRRTDSWSVLVRVVAVTDDPGVPRVVPDLRHRLPGRGAWLHPDTECLERAVRRRAFVRALRLQAGADVGALTAYLDGRAHGTTHDQRQGGSDADEHPMSTHQ
ncbi:MAG: YlxR family protein [Dermatophilaceae bacterium]